MEARPAQPISILRGHKAQVHSAAFVRNSERLATGDADGFVVVWDLTILRPRAVWRAHTNSILGIAGWDSNKIITHGRDNRLIVWKLSPDDESSMSAVVPFQELPESRPHPWMLHLLEVNTMNFCSFSSCLTPAPSRLSTSEILIAVPNTLQSEAIDVFHLPTQHRQHTVRLGQKNGMVMALSLFYRGELLTIVAGYENGLAVVAQLEITSKWNVTYQTRSHSQPILSLDVAPSKEFFLTSSADAIIAKHPIPTTQSEHPQLQVDEPSRQPEQSGDASVKIEHVTGPKGKGISLLSSALAAQGRERASVDGVSEIQTKPINAVNTKHSGQQSLKVRSDGKIYATAGWDGRVRVYSTKTMKEVAVLKWHQAGCYAVAFPHIGRDSQSLGNEGGENADDSMTPSLPVDQTQEEKAQPAIVISKLGQLSVRDQRIQAAKTTHWLAAGSKDGKVSIWDVF